VIWAFPGWSDTRFVWVTPREGAGLLGLCAGAAPAGLAATTAVEAAAATMSAAPDRRFPIMDVFSFGLCRQRGRKHIHWDGSGWMPANVERSGDNSDR
jgi:hypothetical protein